MIARVLWSGVVLAACALAILLTGATDPGPKGRTYWVEFDNVFGLVEGGDFKLGGVKAGETTGFRLTDDEPYRVQVEVVLTEPGLAALREDASCAVRQQSLIGEYYVDCQPGTGELLAQGSTVPVEQTSSTIPIDLVSNVMRLPYRERFRLIISELGVGLAGRPDDLSEVIRRAHPGLRETSQAIEILADQNRQISNFIERSDTVAQAVEPRGRDLSRWAAEASQTAGIQASREESLRQQWELLPVFLAELEPTLAQLDATGRRQIPTIQQLGRTGPELDRFLTALAPFADAARRSNAELQHTAEDGIDALDESSEEVATLRDLAPDAPKVGLPLRQLLQSIDDRRRSTEYDPVAEQLAPPAPDKTAYREGLGLTGMEAFWNYVYGQTLATNSFDEIGHVLRIVLLRDTKCSPHSANPSESDLARCGSFLGPYQPGLENAKGQIGRYDFGPVDIDPTDEAEPDPKDAKPAGHGQDGGSAPGRTDDEGSAPTGSGWGARAPPARKADAGEDTTHQEPRADHPVLDRLLDGVRGNPGADERRKPGEHLLDFLLGP